MAAGRVGRVGVVGAGQMGRGIAHVLALAGLSVTLTDTSAEALAEAPARVGRDLDRQVAKGTVTPEARAEALARISTTPRLADLGPLDMVVEAATEREEVKAAIFAGLAPHLAPSTIVATNTSSLSITRLAAHSGRPDRFVGVHFMNPVPVMPLVELIRGAATSPETFAEAEALVARLGKTAVAAEDYPGFVVNRLLLPMINEAAYALMEGVADAEGIDRAMRLGASHPMGPLALADLIGLDTCLAILKVLHEGFGDPKYRPCPLLARHVAAGWLGRKSGRGFHAYGEAPR